MATTKTKLRIIPLGGVNEFGKNMTVFEYGDDMFLLDAGLMFPQEEMLGIDYVIPDYTYLSINRHKLRGIVFTHGHEDHIGAIPYIYRQFPVPLYGTNLTIGLVNNKLQEHGLKADATVMGPGDKLTMGSFTIEFFKVNHSIAGSVGLIITTPVGVVVHTGDFKIDYTPADGEMIDLPRLSQIGKKGVLCLMSDSTNAERRGYTMSEKIVEKAFTRYFREAPGRIVVATFASNIHRVQQVVDEAVKMGRNVCFVGRSLINVSNVAIALGELTIPSGILVDLEQVKMFDPKDLVIVTTGSQGEPMSGLARMSTDDHRQVEIYPEDTVIISASSIPGNERHISQMVNQLRKKGAQVIYDPAADVHVSGHACQEELKLILGLVKPKYYIPVHGEYSKLVANAELGQMMGLPPENTFVVELGEVLEFTKTGAEHIKEPVPSGQLLIDGAGIGDVGNIVLRDRRILSQDGLMVVVVAFEKESGRIVSGPDLISRGFVYVREAEDMMDEARGAVLTALMQQELHTVGEWSPIKLLIRNTLRDFFYQRLGRSPMILPVVMEV
ncbi:MAG: ribonuclease J [Christensenellales bacterium]|jgi:ribonuclease J